MSISTFSFQHVLDIVEVNTMTDYHDLYLKNDVSLLVDVFEKIKNSSLKTMSNARVII